MMLFCSQNSSFVPCRIASMSQSSYSGTSFKGVVPRRTGRFARYECRLFIISVSTRAVPGSRDCRLPRGLQNMIQFQNRSSKAPAFRMLW
jgi:hypothetical protein